MIASSEPPSADTSRFNASLDRKWESVIAGPELTGRRGRPSNPTSYRDFPDCNHPRRKSDHQSVQPAAIAMPRRQHALTVHPVEATCFRHEQNQFDLRLLRLRSRQQPGLRATPPPTFGRVLAENGIRLVYGGGSVGLMGALAEVGPRPWRAGDRGDPRLSGQSRAYARARAGADHHARHARAQTGHVRAGGCLRRTSRAASARSRNWWSR